MIAIADLGSAEIGDKAPLCAFIMQSVSTSWAFFNLQRRTGFFSVSVLRT